MRKRTRARERERERERERRSLWQMEDDIQYALAYLFLVTKTLLRHSESNTGVKNQLPHQESGQHGEMLGCSSMWSRVARREISFSMVGDAVVDVKPVGPQYAPVRSHAL
jgi:hypothetical protein